MPPLVLLEDYRGDWEEYIEAIYDVFCTDIVDSTPSFRGAPIRLKRHPYLRDKEATFWHVTSEGKQEDQRLPDLRRCERVPWIRPMIEAGDSDRVLHWRNRRSAQWSSIFAVPDLSYVVVARDRGHYLLRWTAYCVEQRHSRDKLRREYESYHGHK